MLLRSTETSTSPFLVLTQAVLEIAKFSWGKVTRGILEYRVIRNDSGIDPSYCKTTDRLDKLFHHEVGASVGSATSTRLAAVRSHSQCRNGKC